MPIIVGFIVDIILKSPVSFIVWLLWVITVRYQILFFINESLITATLLVMFHRLGFGLLLVVRKVLVLLLKELVLLSMMMMSLWGFFLLFSWVLLLLLVLFLLDLIHFIAYFFVFRLLLLDGSESYLTFIDQKVLKYAARIAHEYLFVELPVFIKLHF